MKTIVVALIAILTAGTTAAQVKERALKKVLELKMPLTADDDMCGTRGAAVAWHPVQQKYYASFAGNAQYPMAVFSVAGIRLSKDTLKTGVDTRGLWYNAAAKRLEGNAYADYGWFSYALNAAGMPSAPTFNYEGMNQPDAHKVGVYNSASKKIMFISNDSILFYNQKAERTDSFVVIQFGRAKGEAPREAGIFDDEDAAAGDGYNYTSAVYTGIPGAEIGVLNTEERQVELYSRKTGYLMQKLTLPAECKAEASFNFAYANGMYWFFDMDQRTWVGCK